VKQEKMKRSADSKAEMDKPRLVSKEKKHVFFGIG